jgi:hypothetical protein
MSPAPRSSLLLMLPCALTAACGAAADTEAVREHAITCGGFTTQGLIDAKYAALGGCSSFLGAPITNELTTPDGVGRFNHFANGGSIYWTQATGAHEIHGAIRAAWSALGWETSPLGYPVTDEVGTPDGIGRFNHFQRGSIYFTPTTGAHEVHGLIHDTWASLGWERGALGYPISDELAAPGGRRSEFEHGSLVWSAATNQVTVVPATATPRALGVAEDCKLINNSGVLDPTANQTHFRANLLGTDLGIPVAHGNTLYFFFGDTIGYKGVWQAGESLPDAVGYAAVPASSIAADPHQLCDQLRFLTVAPQASVGPRLDARIQADYAGGAMTAPPGHLLGEFIHNPAAHGAFPNLPGDFEVPSGGFSANGSIYLFYTTVVAPDVVQMKGSYLARWRAPSTSTLPSYEILYGVDQRFDSNGDLRGDFINIAPVVVGAYVYLFGTGEYRQSPIHLARKRLDAIDTPGGFERFDATSQTWRAATAAAAPIAGVPGNGELSVRYFPAIQRWMILNQEQLPGSNRVVARFAAQPEGPWSDAIIVSDMADPQLRQRYCCTATACLGEQLFHCDRAGFYGTYLLPELTLLPGGAFTVRYLMSTWDPYNVALMQATFR